MERKLLAAIDEMAGKGSLGVESKKVWESPAVRFDADCLASVKKSAQAAGYPARDMISARVTMRPTSPESRRPP